MSRVIQLDIVSLFGSNQIELNATPIYRDLIFKHTRHLPSYLKLKQDQTSKQTNKQTNKHCCICDDNELPIICKSCSHHEDKHLIIVWLSWDELLIFIYNNVMYKWWWSLGHQRRISWTLYCDKHLILWWLSCGELIYHLTLIII